MSLYDLEDMRRDSQRALLDKLVRELTLIRKRAEEQRIDEKLQATGKPRLK